MKGQITYTAYAYACHTENTFTCALNVITHRIIALYYDISINYRGNINRARACLLAA